MITEKYFVYDVSSLNFSVPQDNQNLTDGFALRFRLNQKPEAAKTLFEVPGTMAVTVRNVEDGKEGWWDNVENFRSCVEPDGRCRVLEIRIEVTCPDRPKWTTMSIGIPLELLGAAWQERTIVMLYDAVHLRLLVDGEVINENYPVGKLNAPTGPMSGPDREVLADFGLTTSLKGITRTEHERSREGTAQFYMPAGFNVWAGDVVPFFKDGSYHILYLVDRHHHGNRWGGGAHSFQQLVTKDFVNWTEYGPLFELEEPWESVGTGTMFYHNGNYVIGHGWHTSRVIPPERTSSPLMNEAYRKDGVMKMRTYEALGDRYPAGASYAWSTDGIHFTKSRKVIHTAENPSIYAMPDGTLNMYCGGGTWNASQVDGDWKLIANNFPPAGASQPMRNTNECPSFFEWNGWRYLLMGGTGFWMAKPGGDYVDSAAEGMDVYDGLFVPMVAPYTGNRRILCGWPNGQGWGSCVICRELIQYENGRLGMKWVDELRPKPRRQLFSLAQATLPPASPLSMAMPQGVSLLLEMTLTAPQSGRFAIRLRSANGAGSDCEFQLDFDRQRMQISGCNSEGTLFHPIMTVREALRQVPQERLGAGIASPDGIHCSGRNFCLENVDVLKGSFTVKMAVCNSAKLRGSFVDVEIAGQRTLISQRARLDAKAIELIGDETVTLEAVTVSEF